MRVISGQYRGRLIECPKGDRIRPTSDMVRTAVFNILNNRVDWEEINVLDVFCGTGSYGIEAISRGAKFVGFVDNHRESIDITRENITRIHQEKNYLVFPYDATQMGRADREYHVVMMDPPYRTGVVAATLKSLVDHGWLAQGALIAIEESEREKLVIPEGFNEVLRRRYGNTQLLLIEKV